MSIDYSLHIGEVVYYLHIRESIVLGGRVYLNICEEVMCYTVVNGYLNTTEQ